MSDKDPDPPAPDTPEGDRRSGTDRRQSQQPFPGPDRRKGERRSGKDRRETPRSDPEA